MVHVVAVSTYELEFHSNFNLTPSHWEQLLYSTQEIGLARSLLFACLMIGAPFVIYPYPGALGYGSMHCFNLVRLD